MFFETYEAAEEYIEKNRLVHVKIIRHPDDRRNCYEIVKREEGYNK